MKLTTVLFIYLFVYLCSPIISITGPLCEEIKLKQAFLVESVEWPIGLKVVEQKLPEKNLKYFLIENVLWMEMNGCQSFFEGKKI